MAPRTCLQARGSLAECRSRFASANIASESTHFAERWLSGRKQRFAKPSNGLKSVPGVRIPPSPPAKPPINIALLDAFSADLYVPGRKGVVGRGSWTHYLKEPQGGSEEDGPGWGCSRSSAKEPEYYSLKGCNFRLGKLPDEADFHKLSTSLPPIFWILVDTGDPRQFQR